MVNLIYPKSFLKDSRSLPNKIQIKLAECLEVLQKNPFSINLCVKNLTGKLAGFYSFRITRECRVIFYFLDATTIKLFGVGHRKDIYKK